MNTSDPIAIICGVVLISMVLFMLFMLTFIARRSAQDVWDRYDQEAIRARELPVYQWRETLQKRVAKEWSLEDPLPVSKPVLIQDPSAEILEAIATRLPASLTVGRDTYSRYLDPGDLFEDVCPEPNISLQPKRSQIKRKPVSRLPKFFFENKEYRRVPYFAGVELDPQRKTLKSILKRSTYS